MKILTDNQGASFIANDPICHIKMKHVAMDFHFIREKSEAKSGQIWSYFKHVTKR